MAIQSVGATTASEGAKQAFAGGKVVTQDDFLKLLIAQMQNQDPLKPMDNQEFAAQLATFNSLGQLIDINSKLGGMQSNQGMVNNLNAVSLIGKEIETDGNAVSLKEGSPAAIPYLLGANAAQVTVTIRKGSGELVRQWATVNQPAGEQTLVWDGKDSTGKSAPAGLYRFEITAVDATGKNIPSSGLVRGIVTGVNLEGSEPLLEVGGLSVPLSGVTKVRSL